MYSIQDELVEKKKQSISLPSYIQVQEVIKQQKQTENHPLISFEEIVELHRRSYPSLIRKATKQLLERMSGAFLTHANVMKTYFHQMDWKIVIVLLYDLVKGGFPFFIQHDDEWIHLHIYLNQKMYTNTLPYSKRQLFLFPSESTEVERLITLESYYNSAADLSMEDGFFILQPLK